jgi:small-conductance mechanosensitive channel
MANLPEIFQQLLQTSQQNGEIIASLVTLAIVGIGGWVAYFILNRYFLGLAKKTSTTLDDNIVSSVKIIAIILVVILGIEYALEPLSFLQPYEEVLSTVFLVLQVFLAAFAASKIATAIIDWYAARTAVTIGKKSYHIIFLLKKIIQIVAIVFAILIILYIKNFNLTGALVGLGVGGIAIAFALQSTLSDFFSAFSIYFDHPFEIGDFIVVGEHWGTVTNIGVRTTRLQLLQGEELIVSNKELTAGSVRNFKKMEKRRVSFTIGVTYSTPVEKLKKIPQMITDIINSTENASLFCVHCNEFGEYGQKFIIIYYVTSPDYLVYLRAQEKITYAIRDAFERDGIEISVPARAVILRNNKQD